MSTTIRKLTTPSGELLQYRKKFLYIWSLSLPIFFLLVAIVSNGTSANNVNTWGFKPEFLRKQLTSLFVRFYAVPNVIMCSSGCLSQVTTSVLAIVRMISIFLPFLQMPQWIPLTYIALYTFFMTANNFGYAMCQFLELTHSVRRIIVLTVDCCYWLNIVQCILGILASFLTMAKIFSKRKNIMKMTKYVKMFYNNAIIYLKV